MQFTEITSFNVGYYIETPSDVVDTSTLVPTSTCNSTVVDVKDFDSLLLKGYGFSEARLYCFTDSDFNVIVRATSNQNTGNNFLRISIPVKARYMIINTRNNYPYTFYLVKTNHDKDISTSYKFSSGTLTVNTISGEYYSNPDGDVRSSANYYRSDGLIPISVPAILLNTSQYTTHCCMYDSSKNFIRAITLRTVTSDHVLCLIPSTAYIGLSVNSTDHADSISVKCIQGANPKLQYPFSSIDNICYYTDMCYQSGNKISSTSFDACVMIVTPGTKYYTNNSILHQFCCYDSNNYYIGELSPEDYEYCPNNGYIYTIPENATYCYVNISKNKTHGVLSQVFLPIMEDSPKILCIGDSITWLDGRNGYDDATLFLGYQKVLQSEGYVVESAGYSGYTYADDGEHNSIYTKIVEESYDVSSYDYIILFGGTNDDLYEINIGTISADYTITSYDTSTTIGALEAIIDYIRTNNTNCKIILCTLIKSEAVSRRYVQAINYVNAFKQVSEYKSCYLCDLFSNYNVQPYTPGFDVFYYDNTHPNRLGMERLGELILKSVERC